MTLNELFTNIANSIRRKKGTTDKIVPTNFESEIESIETGIDTTDATATANDILKGKTAYGVEGKMEGTIETYNLEMSEGAVDVNTLKTLLDNTKDASYLFCDYKGDNLSDLIQYNDTENVEQFRYMYGGSAATSLPQINTSKGTKFNNMYGGCYNATSLPLTDISKGTDFSSMYKSCSKATKIEILNFTCSADSRSESMFVSCYLLKALIIRSFGNKYILASNAFNLCYWMNGTTNATHNPNGEYGYVYVPRDMITTLQSATNWSKLQYRALEDYTKDGTTTGEFDDEKAGI